MMHFADRVREHYQKKKSIVVVGIDPRLDRIPVSIRKRRKPIDAVLIFNKAVIDAVAPHALAVKPQIAFFEPFGPAGIDCYLKTIAYAKRQDLLVIGDVKRGDISSTAAAYALAHIGRRTQSDAITINPWFGSDGLEPFIQTASKNHRGLFVLLKTSNPSSAEIQDLPVDGKPLYESVAGLLGKLGGNHLGESGYSLLGVVVGATWPETAQRLRHLLPRSIFLLPGYGSQGGDLEGVRCAMGNDPYSVLVNSSRGIIYAFTDEQNWQSQVNAAAEKMKNELAELIPEA